MTRGPIEDVSIKAEESSSASAQTTDKMGATAVPKAPNGEQSAAAAAVAAEAPVSSSAASSSAELTWTADNHPHRRVSDKTRRSILAGQTIVAIAVRSEEHTSELQS